MAYVDGFIVPVPVAAVDAYLALAASAAEVWVKNGALSVVEAAADDAPMGEITSFPRSVLAKADETVFFSYITYRDRAHRDEVNARVMANPEMMAQMTTAPFDTKRMIWGGFAICIAEGTAAGG